MVGFISKRIIAAAKVSFEAGRAKYLAYFPAHGGKNDPWKAEVNEVLILEGYADIIPVE